MKTLISLSNKSILINPTFIREVFDIIAPYALASYLLTVSLVTFIL